MENHCSPECEEELGGEENMFVLNLALVTVIARDRQRSWEYLFHCHYHRYHPTMRCISNIVSSRQI